MRKVWLVVKREYLTRVCTKGFIFGTFAVPLIRLAMIMAMTANSTEMGMRGRTTCQAGMS